MNARITFAVAGRVIRQLRRDRRTVAMLLVLPCAVLTLLWWMFDSAGGPAVSTSAAGSVAASTSTSTSGSAS